LNSPGEWFEDTQNHLLYYMPRPGEVQLLNTAGIVIAPNQLADAVPFSPPYPLSAGQVVSGFTAVSPPLMEVGTTGSAASNVSIQGIHFEYSSWLDPTFEGYRGMQAGLILQGSYQSPATDKTRAQKQAISALQGVPEGAVNIYGAHNISLANNTFEHLGGAGLTIYGGLGTTNQTPSGDLVRANAFSDIAASAIIVNGDPRDQQTATQVSWNDNIQNNTITEVGQDYHDAAGILTTYCHNLTIANNTLHDLPTMGIAVTDDHLGLPYSLVNVTNNNIFGFSQVLQDGGGIYLDGQNLYSQQDIFSTSVSPPTSQQNVTDSNIATHGGIELGLKFRSDVAGVVNGARFWKSSGTTGPLSAQLWSSSGQLLATAAFAPLANSNLTGWLQVMFPNPIQISANATYIIAYHTTSSNISYTANTFSSAGTNNGALHALQNGTDGPNGVFSYDTVAGQPSFPNQYNGQAPFYWVDVVFNEVGSTVSGNYVHDSLWPRQANQPFLASHNGVLLDSGGGLSSANGVTVGANVAFALTPAGIPPAIAAQTVSPFSATVIGTTSYFTNSIENNNYPEGPGQASTLANPSAIVEGAGVAFSQNEIQAEDYLISSGMPAAQSALPYRLDTPAAQVTTYTGPSGFVGSVVGSMASGEDLTYWFEAPTTGHYDFELFASSDQLIGAGQVKLKVDNAVADSLVASMATQATGGHPGATQIRGQGLYDAAAMTAGYHRIDLVFSGTLTDLEVDAFSILLDPSVPAAFYWNGGTSRVAIDSNTIWGVAADLSQAAQSLTVPIEIPVLGVYQVELRYATGANHAALQVQLYNGSQQIGATLVAKPPRTGNLSNPTPWIVATIGTRSAPLTAGGYNLKITYLNSTSHFWLESVNVLPTILYPPAGA
jgi:hypothetical protein